MKNLQKWATLAIVCFMQLTASLYACTGDESCNKVIELNQKFYVNLNQINFNDQKIYISIDDLIYQTPAIHSDEAGYYIEKIAESGSCSWYEWQCSRCGYCNLRGLDYKCRSCRKGISE